MLTSLMVKEIAIGKYCFGMGGLRFDYRPSQTAHNVANGSPPLRAVLPSDYDLKFRRSTEVIILFDLTFDYLVPKYMDQSLQFLTLQVITKPRLTNGHSRKLL